MLPKERRLTRVLFDTVRKSPLVVGGKDISLRFISAPTPGRFSVVVPKSVFKKAVLRNKIRRVVYHTLFTEKAGFNGIFYIKIPPTSPDQAKKSVCSLLALAQKTTKSP